MDRSKVLLKRKDMGLASVIIVLTQIISTFNSSQKNATDFKELKASFDDLHNYREKFLVKKDDLKSLTTKLDRLHSQFVKLNKEIKSIKNDYASRGGLDVTFK
jgi:chromosome segregation ATPase